MRVLLHANVDFVAWTAHLARALADRHGDFSADAVVTLDHGTAEALRRQGIFPFGTVTCLSDLEADWLAEPDGEARLGAITHRLGSACIREIGTADREISGFASPHARIAETPLKRATRDPARRAAYLSGLIGTLEAMLDAGGYDAIIATSVQDAPGVALAQLARQRGIAFLSPKPIGFRQITALFDDPGTMNPCFRRLFAAAMAEPDRHEALMAEGAACLAQFRARPVPPDYMASPVNSPFSLPRLMDSAALIWRILRRRAPETLRYPYPASRRWEEWRRAFLARRLRQSPIFVPRMTRDSAPSLYFPLHYEPEASLLVSAPHATDQLAIIGALHAALPEGWTLDVKEHRPMLGRRPAGFYERLAAMPRLRLVSPFEDGFAMIANAGLTATITGSAGMESVLLGRPTLFFGDQPIQIIGSGFHRAGKDEPMAQSIARALATPPASPSCLHAFLGAMITDGLDVPTDHIWGGLAALPFERVAHDREAVDRLADLVLAAIERG